MTKIKQFLEGEKGKTALTISIVVLVGLASFELGRLSKHPSTGVNIDYSAVVGEAFRAPEVTAAAINTLNTPVTTSSKKAQNEGYFASNRGHKYYPIDCSAGKNIVMENRIYFATEADAVARGFERSASCR